MKTSNLIFTLLYLGFVLINVALTMSAVIMITIEGNEMMDEGLLLLFLEMMVFLILKRKSTHDEIETSHTTFNH